MGLYLLNLPEKLLLMIMKLLDPGSIQCLRRTNRIFLRLFSNSAFRDFHHHISGLPDLQAYTEPFQWRRASLAFEREAYSESVRGLLRSEESRKQCITCQNTNLHDPQLATDLAKSKRFCGACWAEHPAAFFPASERDNDQLVKDTCIGHTGYVRLCEHEVITRGEIAQRWSSALRLGDINDEEAKCILLKTCSHPSHAPKVEHRVTGSEGMKTYRCPEAALWRRGSAVVLTLKWRGHICQVPHGLPIPATLMEERIRDLRRGAAEYIVPQAAPGTLPEMRCFDPNKCGCLDYGSRYPPNSLWAGTSGEDSCLVDPSRRLLPLPAPSTGSTPSQINCDVNALSHFTRSRLSDALREFSGYSIKVRRCSASAQCLQVFYYRRIACGPAWQPEWRTVDYSWFEALDPDSYSLFQDQDTRGALWCVDPSCTNFYRYLGRPIVRKCCGPAIANFFEPHSLKDLVPSRISGTWYKTQRSAAIRVEQSRLESSRSSKAATADSPAMAIRPTPNSETGTVPAAVNTLSITATKARNPAIPRYITPIPVHGML